MSDSAFRLHNSVAVVCPIVGVSIGTAGVSASVRIDFDPTATPTQQTDAQSVVDAFDWSQGAQDAYDNAQARTQATVLVSDPQAQLKVLRALMLTALDEINLLRERDVDRAADVAVATSLVDLKTRWAARPALAARTAVQLRTAITNKINAGDADN